MEQTTRGIANPDLVTLNREYAANHVQRFNMAGFRAPKLDTVRGRTMMIQHDAHTPTPHNLIHGIYGTRGAAQFDPDPPRFSKGDHRWYRKGHEEYERLYKEYTPEIYKAAV